MDSRQGSPPPPDDAAAYAIPRKEERLSLLMPVQVRTYSPKGAPWEEEALMQDVSTGGMAFRSLLPLRKGQVVQLEAPVPKSLRQFGKETDRYHVYAIVRNVLVDDEGCRIGVMFFGKEPPRGYERNPAARYLLPSDLQTERRRPKRPHPEPEAPTDPAGKRRHERFDMFVELELFHVDEWGTLLEEERTVAENISLGGARVLTNHTFAVGDVIVVREVGGAFKARAEIVGTYVGANSVRRLNLKFLDGVGPTHLVKH
ncbi:MAG TPA: PilZ domain-containing protein [Vicinamibacteria bacterium]|nr:PilZ domain-containing protein [Vicinamibacteria bacterium]